jgi:hypothetical protein
MPFLTSSSILLAITRDEYIGDREKSSVRPNWQYVKKKKKLETPERSNRYLR